MPTATMATVAIRATSASIIVAVGMGTPLMVVPDPSAQKCSNSLLYRLSTRNKAKDKYPIIPLMSLPLHMFIIRSVALLLQLADTSATNFINDHLPVNAHARIPDTDMLVPMQLCIETKWKSTLDSRQTTIQALLLLLRRHGLLLQHNGPT